MTYKLTRKEQDITINRVRFSKEDVVSDSFKDHFLDEFGDEIAFFLQEWFNDHDTISLQTSGSTGTPKVIVAQKKAMIHSAWMTCEALSLSSKTNALLCLPVSAIAGKMMLVRALVSGMNIDYVSPSGNPLRSLDSAPDFVAMVPLQVFNSLQSMEETKILQEIENLIIGGGFVDNSIVGAIRNYPNNIYVTYGMTETLSHVALRKLTNTDNIEYYTPFSSVELSLSSDRCLQIKAPYLLDSLLITNDIAEIREDGTFKILGRKDNTINSGGVKIQIEVVEQKLAPYIDGDFAITSIPNIKFGELVVLLYTLPFDDHIAFADLTYYQIPKYLFLVSDIPFTRTGKIDRAKCKELAFLSKK